MPDARTDHLPRSQSDIHLLVRHEDLLLREIDRRTAGFNLERRINGLVGHEHCRCLWMQAFRDRKSEGLQAQLAGFQHELRAEAVGVELLGVASPSLGGREWSFEIVG